MGAKACGGPDAWICQPSRHVDLGRGLSAAKARGRPETVCDDVPTYRVPDEITVVFLYATCSGELLCETFTRVLESYDRNPRKLRIAYCNPREHDLVLTIYRFVPTGRMHFSWRPGKD